MDEELKNRGWHELTFLDIAKSLKRGPFGGNLKKAFFVPTGYKVYEQQHAINKDFQLGTYFINDKKYEELKGFAVGSGDYIISCSGTIGKLYRLPKEAPSGVINQALLKITLEDGLLTHSYFSYLFQSAYFQRQILSDARGTGMQNLAGMKEIKVVPVFIPPFPEQRKIVEKLDELISELDNGIANLKAAKDKLEIYRQAVLKKAFEGELTKEWRIKQKKEIKLEFIGFGDLCKFTQGIQVPIPNQSEVQKKGQVRFLRIIDFTQGNEPPRFIDNPGERYLVNSSDIALVRYGTVGFVCTGKEGAIANNLFKVAPDERLINPYLIHFLNSHLFKSHLKPKGATMQALSFGLIKPIPIPVFEIDEQKQIVQEIESRLSVCDNILASIEEGLEKSEALRQSILKQAFEGKLLSDEELEACRKEPDWEPAEKLLERLKNRDKVESKKVSHA